MLACAKSRVGSSSSTCAMWAWPHHSYRHSLAQWPSLSQLRLESSRASFWLPGTPLQAPPSACPRAPAWVPLCALRGLPRLRPPIEEEDSPFFSSPWQASHYSRVRYSFPPMVIGPERVCGSSSSTTLRRSIASSIGIVEWSSRDSIDRAICLYFLGMQQKSFLMALSSL
jgi:hypothetical protein